ncbi:MAG: deoxyribose-phosphate aldolase [Hyphomicrobiales bacterium]|nr:deoxyribose-phosphate aldolase [Hyphomicrobiales bacterium]MDE2115827.1 deoxyribose-phosphate aldolase [Hyphomicrobiales bacterium]
MTTLGPIGVREIVHLLDLTNLNESCTMADVDALCTAARTRLGDVAAVCIWPQFVALARARRTSIQIATVINFPHGEDSLADTLAATQTALAEGADEIDLVLPYRAFLAGDQLLAREMIAGVAALTCGRARLKVILETGALQEPDLIRQASELAIAAGADFLKTSTGKIAVSATLPAATAMLDVIARAARPVGFKVAGGVRTLGDARPYMDLAAKIMGREWIAPQNFRIGASGLLSALLAQEDGQSAEMAGNY